MSYNTLFLFAKRPTCQLACSTLLPVLTWKHTRAITRRAVPEIYPATRWPLLSGTIFSPLYLLFGRLECHAFYWWPINSLLTHSATNSAILIFHSAVFDSHSKSISVDFISRQGNGIIQSINSCRFGIPETKKKSNPISRSRYQPANNLNCHILLIIAFRVYSNRSDSRYSAFQKNVIIKHDAYLPTESALHRSCRSETVIRRR